MRRVYAHVNRPAREKGLKTKAEYKTPVHRYGLTRGEFRILVLYTNIYVLYIILYII